MNICDETLATSVKLLFFKKETLSAIYSFADERSTGSLGEIKELRSSYSRNDISLHKHFGNINIPLAIPDSFTKDFWQTSTLIVTKTNGRHAVTTWLLVPGFFEITMRDNEDKIHIFQIFVPQFALLIKLP